MTRVDRLPDLIVRIDGVIAAEQAALLHDQIRSRVETVAEDTTAALGVDAAAVSIELVPVPTLQLTLRREVSVEEIAELKQRWLTAHGRPLVDPRGMVQAREPWWRRWFRRD